MCYIDNNQHKPKFDLARHVTCQHDMTLRRIEPMHFACVKLVEQHGSTHSTQRARLAQHTRLDTLDTSKVL